MPMSPLPHLSLAKTPNFRESESSALMVRKRWEIHSPRSFGSLNTFSVSYMSDENIKDKLNECNIPSEVLKRILDDVFGCKMGTIFQEGLVESDNEDYQSKLECLTKSWQNTQMSSAADIERFLQWFLTKWMQFMVQCCVQFEKNVVLETHLTPLQPMQVKALMPC